MFGSFINRFFGKPNKPQQIQINRHRIGNPPNDTGWYRRNANLRPMLVTERMLMRHGWYRRKLRKEGVAIDPSAKNSMVLR